MICSKDNFASDFTQNALKYKVSLYTLLHLTLQVIWSDKKIELTIPTRLTNLEMRKFECNSEIGDEKRISYLFPVILNLKLLNLNLKYNAFILLSNSDMLRFCLSHVSSSAIPMLSENMVTKKISSLSHEVVSKVIP